MKENSALSISAVAKRYDISVRTLHYYDEIGLLSPAYTTDAGYRFYDAPSLQVLQRILFFRELEIPLAEIKAILIDPRFDEEAHREVLVKQRELLRLKLEHLQSLLKLTDEAIRDDMTADTQKERNQAMEKKNRTAAELAVKKEQYAAEVREKWGDTAAYRESEEKHAGFTSEKEVAIAEKADAIFGQFADAMKAEKTPTDTEVQALVAQWQAHITKFHYQCTNEILSCLGQMYTGDERFAAYLDRFGDGTARFMQEAIAVYCAE